MPDARCTRGLVAKGRTKIAHEHTGSGGNPTFPAQWLYAYFALSPEYRAFLPPSPHGNWHSGPVGLSHLR